MSSDLILEYTASVKNIVESVIGFEVAINESRHGIFGWDSLKYVEVIMIIQQKFKIAFSIPDIIEAESISDLVKLIIKESKR